MGWATFGAIFSKTRLVTLAAGFTKEESSFDGGLRIQLLRWKI
jgi:hypothetical protein